MKVLFIDDYEVELQILKVALSKIEGIEPIFAHGQKEIALMKDQFHSLDAVVTDFRLHGHNGDDIVKYLRERGVCAPIFLLSGSPEAPKHSELYNEIYKKPFTMYGWVDTVKEIQSAIECLR